MSGQCPYLGATQLIPTTARPNIDATAEREREIRPTGTVKLPIESTVCFSAGENCFQVLICIVEPPQE